MIKRIAVAFEAGRDGFWLARWLRARDIEVHVIHASSVAVSREHRRAKTDRLDTELLKRAFADLKAWERKHGRVPKGAFVALRTDMYKDWGANPERFKRSPFPAWAFETIKLLYEQRGVAATGHESMDTDITARLPAAVCFFPETGRFSKKNREAIEHERAITDRD